VSRKKFSFDFTEGLAFYVRAKPNLQNARRHKIGLKCVVGFF
jgi:hypothetical protein